MITIGRLNNWCSKFRAGGVVQKKSEGSYQSWEWWKEILWENKKKRSSEFRTVNYQHGDNDVIKVGSRKEFVK